MRANVIRTDNPDFSYTLAAGSGLTQDAINYFRQGYESFVNRAGVLGNEFANSVSNMYNYFNNSSVIQNTKELLTSAGMITGEDVIYGLNNDTIHNPGYLMRRYVMSEPELYNKYNHNRCSGYNDEWFNPEPYEKVATMREDYLNVTEGLIQYDEDDNAYTTFTSTENGNPLSVSDRLVILNAWELAKLKMINGTDPSDPEMGEIG